MGPKNHHWFGSSSLWIHHQVVRFAVSCSSRIHWCWHIRGNYNHPRHQDICFTKMTPAYATLLLPIIKSSFRANFNGGLPNRYDFIWIYLQFWIGAYTSFNLLIDNISARIEENVEFLEYVNEDLILLIFILNGSLHCRTTDRGGWEHIEETYIRLDTQDALLQLHRFIHDERFDLFCWGELWVPEIKHFIEELIIREIIATS